MTKKENEPLKDGMSPHWTIEWELTNVQTPYGTLRRTEYPVRFEGLIIERFLDINEAIAYCKALNHSRQYRQGWRESLTITDES